jgi:hypothetical protein
LPPGSHEIICCRSIVIFVCSGLSISWSTSLAESVQQCFFWGVQQFSCVQQAYNCKHHSFTFIPLGLYHRYFGRFYLYIQNIFQRENSCQLSPCVLTIFCMRMTCHQRINMKIIF